MEVASNDIPMIKWKRNMKEINEGRQRRLFWKLFVIGAVGFGATTVLVGWAINSILILLYGWKVNEGTAMAIVNDAAWMRANLDNEFKLRCSRCFLDAELNLYKGDGFVSIDGSVIRVCAWKTKDGRRWLRFSRAIGVHMTDIDDAAWCSKNRGPQRQDARILMSRFERRDLTQADLEKYFEQIN